MRTESPISHFCFFNHEAAGVGWRVAGNRPNDTRHIAHRSAAATDQMVMVVSGARLKSHGRTSRFEAAQDAALGQGMEGVINRLGGHRAKLCPDPIGHLICCDMRVGVDGFQHRKPRLGDPQASPPQSISPV